MKNKKKIVSVILGGFFILLAAGIFLAAGYLGKASGSEEEVPETVSSQAQDDLVYYQGQAYRYRSEWMNILFLGVDKSEPVTLQNTAGTAGQADCIMLLSFNRDTKQAEILQISRDSMTDVDIYDINGEYYTTVTAQLAAQYAYGKGEKSSCWAMEQTVSELLFDLPIDGYLAVTVDSIGIINDAVGGVTLTLTEDCTDLDPSYTKGSVITLNGEEAEEFVRYRDTTVQGSNNQRMRRQVQYIPALIQAIRSKMGNSGEYYEILYPKLAEYMVTDLTAEQLNALGEYEPDMENVFYVPGEIKAGEVNEEFHVDDEQLQEMLLERFYEPVETE